MRATETVRLVLGAMLMACVLYALVAAPGFLSDLTSTVLDQPLREASR